MAKSTPPSLDDPRLRCDALRQRFGEAGIDSLLVTSLPNVRYLTGFTGSSGAVLIAPHETVLFTDPRYTVQSRDEVTCRVQITKGRTMLQAAAQRVKTARLGFDPRQMNVATHAFLRKTLAASIQLVPADGLVERQRMVKSPGEIDRIRRAVQTNSKAYAAALKSVKPGLRESDLAAEIDHQIRRCGAEGICFETIVASGARAALPHARPTRAEIQPNRLLLIDMGACQEGYASDMTRTVGIGQPDRRLRTAYNAVLEAQMAAVDAVRPGVAFSKLDKVARDVLRKHGWEKAFVHSLGHGLGLEIHESPRLARGEKGHLAAGMAITIEPGVYIAGDFGIRIEDTVLVTATGHEVLTPTPKSYQVF